MKERTGQLPLPHEVTVETPQVITPAEHKARAMLLGLQYDPLDRTYWRVTTDLTATTSDGMITGIVMLDCDTLEPVLVESREKRVQRGVPR